jgi:hypothetical protein
MMKHERVQRERRRLLEAGRRHWLDDDDDDDDISVAQREAGHIVCGWLLHLNPIGATINGGTGYGGKTSFGRAISRMTESDRAYVEAVCRMAGSEASFCSTALVIAGRTIWPKRARL